jgi:hypothetical protein
VLSEPVMAMRDHHVEKSEAGEVWLSLWLGAALVAMVAFSYWLNLG